VRDQFTGMAKMQCEIGKKRKLRITRMVGISNFFSTLEVITEKVLAGIWLTSEASKYTVIMM